MVWRQIKASGRRADLDEICAIMSMLEASLEIEDFSDVSADPVYGELIDEEILKKDKSRVSVSIYISEEKSAEEYLAFLKARFFEMGIEAELLQRTVDESEWENSWKQYYKPVFVGERIAVIPKWEEYEQKPTDVVIKMDPGMAFGTGTHETTRLCLLLIEKYMQKGSTVLDVGTGSGILSICAEKLGAGKICAYDIDAVAVRVAKENFADNGCKNIECGVSDLVRDVQMPNGKPFDMVIANIVADIIIRMLPDLHKFIRRDTTLLLSGIIADSAQRVRQCAEENGFVMIEEISENDWKGFAMRYIGA